MQATLNRILQLSGLLHIEDFEDMLLSPEEKITFEGFIKANDEQGLIKWIKEA